MATLTGTALYTAAAAGGAAGGAEVATLDAAGTTLFVLGPSGIDALDAATGARLYGIPGTTVLDAGGNPVALGTGNSMAVNGTTLAACFDGPTPASPGTVALYDLAPGGATFRTSVSVGAVPDQLVFTPDGTRLLVAIEGEPAPGYAADPAGGVAVIDVAAGTATFAGFGGFDAATLRAAGVRLTGRADPTAAANTALAANDLEPEYIALSADGSRAYVTLQEGNALGVLDLAAPGGPAFLSVLPLGLKDHGVAGQGLDASDRDGGPRIGTQPVLGMYQPDGIATFEAGGRRYVVTANEGDAREWGDFVEEIRVGDAAYVLDPAAFPNAAALKADAALGRLTVSRHTGDTDGDGDFDQIHAFGGRSLSIFEVTDATLTRVYDSGDQIERILAAQYPALLDESRSDNKGPEPEGLTLTTIGGTLHALVGLERSNAVMAFRIDAPTAATFAGVLARPGDVGPEVFVANAAGDRLYVANETSATATAYAVAAAPAADYTLQILHGSDFEAGLAAVGRADRFAAIVDRLEDATPNSITLSGGDNYLPSPFLNASVDPSVRDELQAFYARLLGVPPASLSGLTQDQARVDIAVLNAIGVQASAIGNHEWDLGTTAFANGVDVIAGTAGTPAGARVSNIGAQFPYLSANLDFSGDAAVRALYATTLRDAATYATTAADLADNSAVAAEAADTQVAPWTTIREGGQTIGVLGLTTQLLASLSSIGGVRVLDPAGDGGLDNTAELATILQPYVDQMTAQGIDKIILLSHLQQYQLELDLATKLSGVDVIVAAGSHAVFADASDALRAGDTAQQGYPVFRTGLDGHGTAIVSTGNEYSYVGRLVVTFDAAGHIVPTSVDPAVSGAVATTDAGVAALYGAADPYAAGTRGAEVRALVRAVGAVIDAKDGVVLGRTGTYLEGRRGEVRTEETNLGDLSSDANLFVARQFDPGVVASIKNGGGLRAEIGSLTTDALPREIPPAANPSAGKPAGGVSQLDVENSLRFNNALSVVSVTAAEFERLLEHSVAATAPGATPGQFGQTGGLAYSFDATQRAQVLGAGGVATAEGLRVRSAALLNDDGTVADELVRDGALVGDAGRAIKFVTLSFLADGGDGYPMNFYADSRVDLLGNAALGDGAATFAAKGSEQDALAEYLRARHPDASLAYNQADLGPAGDARAQNLAFRAADILQVDRAASGTYAGTGANERIAGSAGADAITASGGRDTVDGGAGLDTLTFAQGRGDGGLLLDAAGTRLAGFTFADAAVGTSTTSFANVERVRFADGTVDFSTDSAAVQVSALYRFALDRAAEGYALGVYAEQADQGGATGIAGVAAAILRSPEAASVLAGLDDAALVRRAFTTLLARDASAADLAFYGPRLGVDGTAGLARDLLNSAEFDLGRAGLASRGVAVTDPDSVLVARGYQALLGRNAEGAALDFYGSLLDAGGTPAGVYTALVNSAEFGRTRGQLSDAGYVDLLYDSVLGRDAGDAETAFYAAQLGAGVGRGAVAAAFIGSPEGYAALNDLAGSGIDLL